MIAPNGNFPFKDLWKGYPEFQEVRDELDASAHDKILHQLGDDGSVQEIAHRLLKAAFLKDKLYQAVQITKELLEKAVEMYNFPSDFMHHIQQAVESKTAANQAAKAAETEHKLALRITAGTALPADAADQVQVSNTTPRKDSLELHVQRPVAVANGGFRPTTVLTNHFNVTLTPGQKFYEYEVQDLQSNDPPFSAPKKRVLIERMIETSDVLKKHQDDIASDYERKIISLTALHRPGDQPKAIVDSCAISNYNMTSNGTAVQQLPLKLVYMREITLQGMVDFVAGRNEHYQETGAGQAMNILIARGVHAGNSGAFQVGDNRFFTPDLTTDFEKHGMIAMRGFYSSIRPGNGSVLLNVNTAMSAFYKKQKVSEYMETFNKFGSNKVAKDHLRGLRVFITYERCKEGETDTGMDTEKRRTKTITGFSKGTAAQTMFTDRHGDEVSVWQHFEENYPNVAKESKKGGNQICVNTRGTKEGEECWYLPDQLNVLPGQIYRKTLDKLDPDMTSEMIKLACNTPSINKDLIQSKGLDTLGFRDSRNPPPFLSRAGISVDNTMINVRANVVQAPVVLYKDIRNGKQPAQTDTANWSTRNMTFWNVNKEIKGDVVFLQSSVLAKPDLISTYVAAFRSTVYMNGIARANILNRYPVIHDFSPTRLRELLESGDCAKAGLFVLIIPKQDKANREHYANFRIVADQMIGKPSIVFCEQRLIQQGKNLVPYMANNAMKINLRLGNANHTVENKFGFLSRKNVCDTLILGADLIHPKKSASADGTPSIGAVVGSVDGDYNRFLGSARRQRAGKEYIDGDEMQRMVLERIMAWQKANGGIKPARILYYRDGVGNSQYVDIRHHEIPRIRDAWDKAPASPGNKGPKLLQITTVVVTKRHHSRFYPLPNATGKEEITKTENCVPGTVVDTSITSPYYFDFYLQSHEPEKGLARLTYYVVLQNEMNFGAEELQELTNALCYTFQHSTSAVGYVSPAYYADKLCERAALYLRPFFDGDQKEKDMGTKQREDEMEFAWHSGKQFGNPWNAKFNETMFWM